MMRRAFIRLIVGLAIAWPLASYAQQPKQPLRHPIRQVGLGELGWVEGQNLAFDCVSLAKPEGNVTGVAYFGLLPKQMELLKEIVPNLRRVGAARLAAIPAGASPASIGVQSML